MARMIITGRKPIIEALKAGRQIQKILVLARSHGRIVDEVRDLARKRDIPCEDVGRQDFDALSPGAATQGIIALTTTRPPASLEDVLEVPARKGTPGLLLVCDEIEDPQNLGALIRSAECAGAHGVIVPRHHSAPISATVVKASAGATEHLLVAEVTNIAQTLTALKDAGYWIVGLAGDGDRIFTGIDYRGPTALVVGNEGRGIRRLVREHCDFLARIPLHGSIDSLNASVAGALVLFEAARQRSSPIS